MQEDSIKWVRLKKYCESSGDTFNAVHTRRRKGQWLDGVQCKIGPDGNLWVNLIEVSKWIEKGKNIMISSSHEE